MKKLLITGGAGFLGTNLAIALSNVYNVILVDNFSRTGSRSNEKILDSIGLKVNNIDICNKAQFHEYLFKESYIDCFIHLAAQVSLVESYKEPEYDFYINAIGTINLLEFIRLHSSNSKGIFLSSNKIYGNLHQVKYTELGLRYDLDSSKKDFDESLPLRPKGGYSISKSILDMYVRDYGNRFGLQTVSLRQSAVYGPNQNASSDQGWVSFLIDQLIAHKTIALRGNGKQVRDILFIDDFVELIKILIKIDFVPGEFYNVGGGKNFSLSILELFNIFREFTSYSPSYVTSEMDRDDQKYFVSDNSKISSFTHWSPKINPKFGIEKLIKEKIIL